VARGDAALPAIINGQLGQHFRVRAKGSSVLRSDSVDVGRSNSLGDVERNLDMPAAICGEDLVERHAADHVRRLVSSNSVSALRCGRFDMPSCGNAESVSIRSRSGRGRRSIMRGARVSDRIDIDMGPHTLGKLQFSSALRQHTRGADGDVVDRVMAIDIPEISIASVSVPRNLDGARSEISALSR